MLCLTAEITYSPCVWAENAEIPHNLTGNCSGFGLARCFFSTDQVQVVGKGSVHATASLLFVLDGDAVTAHLLEMGSQFLPLCINTLVSIWGTVHCVLKVNVIVSTTGCTCTKVVGFDLENSSNIKKKKWPRIFFQNAELSIVCSGGSSSSHGCICVSPMKPILENMHAYMHTSKRLHVCTKLCVFSHWCGSLLSFEHYYLELSVVGYLMFSHVSLHEVMK